MGNLAKECYKQRWVLPRASLRGTKFLVIFCQKWSSKFTQSCTQLIIIKVCQQHVTSRTVMHAVLQMSLVSNQLMPYSTTGACIMIIIDLMLFSILWYNNYYVNGHGLQYLLQQWLSSCSVSCSHEMMMLATKKLILLTVQQCAPIFVY